MTESLVPCVVAKRTARAAKCDRDIKLHIPEALYDDLSALARMDRRALSEYIRVTLEQHVYGTISVYRG